MFTLVTRVLQGNFGIVEDSFNDAEFFPLINSCEKDVTLNILSVLSELLSAGTHRRIHYMISKGGSEALLQTLVNLARSDSLDYSLLLPLLRLVVKVGQRDANFGEKAQKLEATDVTLSLIRRNLTKSDNITLCIHAIQIYASNGMYVYIGPKFVTLNIE
ncbi:unnamed protein product [Ranitomeya imitator]|uniref:Uncharacterized protein n=1 Tax=Ranitomeya imitator TaxID=111125 RepID=A0ABN9MJ47_9NEOB|nr:unnamed protein product [Ranitomeya imitator]